MSDFITPTVGRVVWFYPDSNSANAGFHPHADGGGPYAALIAHVWHDRMVNLSVLDANGNAHSRTSVPLLQGDEAVVDSAFCMWMPFQKGQAKAQAVAPAGETHASSVLYPAIREAMAELAVLHPGFNDRVNRAWNHLHRAYWSEVPAPASAPGLRDPVASEKVGIDLSPTEQQTAVEQVFQAKGATSRTTPAIVRETIDYRRHMAFEQVETHRIQVAKLENNLAKERCDHRDAVQLLAELDQWIAANPAPAQ